MRFEPRPISYTIGSNFFRAIYRLFHKLKVYGHTLCPTEGPLIIIANHASYLDPPLISVAFRQRRVHFMAKKELWSGPFLNWYMTSIGAIPVERRGGGKEAIEEAIKVINAGGCLGMFPEGTRTKTGELQKGHSGAVVIAAKTNATILPVFIEGTYESFPIHAKKYKFHPMKVYTGEPFSLTEEERDLDDRARLRQTAEMLMTRIADAKRKWTDAK